MSDQEQVLRQARQALAQGNRPVAQRLLAQAVKQDPTNHRIWLWLAGVAPTAEASRTCIEKAAALQPDHPLVAKARRWLQPQSEGPSAAPVADPRAGSSDLHDPVTTPSDSAPAGDELEEAPQTMAAAIAAQPEPAPVDLRQVAAAPAAADSRRPQRSNLRRLIALAVVLLLIPGLILGALWWQFGGTSAAPAAAVSAEETPASPTQAGTQVAENDEAPPLPPTTAPTGIATATPTALAERALAKTIVDASEEPLPRWTATATPSPTPPASPTPTPSPTLQPTFISGANSNVTIPLGVGLNERWVDVNLSSQTLTAYEGNRAVFSTLISSGLPGTPTVTGQFRIYLTYTAQTMDGRYLGYDYYLPNVPYVMYFYQGYALHGTYWHSNFGRPMSHGCVNLETSDAQWIFNWAGIGTLVNVHY